MNSNKLFSVSAFLLFSLLLVVPGEVRAQDRGPAAKLAIPRVDEVKIALIGDTGVGSDFSKVLRLVRDEQVDIVMINGDLGYGASPESWKQKLLAELDPQKIKIIGSLGNHDVEVNPQAYIPIFASLRSEQNGLKTNCSGTGKLAEGVDTVAVDEVCDFGNVSIVSSAIGQVHSNKYLEDRLQAKLAKIPTQNWKLVGYHFTLADMNPGMKGDQNSHRFFDLIRQYGAIGAQAHTHSAMASCPIFTPFQKGVVPQCHPKFTDLHSRFVVPGIGLYVDSSLGGVDVRSRKRCQDPQNKGCQHMVDLITDEGYTRTDGIRKTDFNRMGALFLTLNVQQNPKKAIAYFKSIDGQEIFNFTIDKD